MLDFKDIKTGEDFELLCEDLLKEMGFEIESRPARGPYQGKDMIAIRRVQNEFDGSQEQRFLVECKHHAVSGKSVIESDVQSISDRTLDHNCTHYLLITSTIPSESVKNHIEEINKNSKIPIEASFWAKHDLDKRLNEHPEIWERHTGQQIPKKITPQIFKMVDSVLDRSLDQQVIKPIVFICHASEDKEIATNLCKQLKSAGIKPWIDRENLRGGDIWDERIKKVIKEDINYFIVLQSCALLKKIESYVNKEINLALDRQKLVRFGFSFIIPVKIENCNLLDDLKHIQTIDLSKGDGIEKLIGVIKDDQLSRSKYASS